MGQCALGVLADGRPARGVGLRRFEAILSCVGRFELRDTSELIVPNLCTFLRVGDDSLGTLAGRKGVIIRLWRSVI